MTDMSRIVTLLCFFCTFCCAGVYAVDIPANPPLVWSPIGDEARVQCGLTGSRFWWSGTDVNDYTTFERIGSGNELCLDGSDVCNVLFTHFNKDPHTYICCTENGPPNINSAQFIDCHEIAVCPGEGQLSPPLIVEADHTETVQMRVTTKPPPTVAPESLLQISIEGGPVINTTSAVAIQGEVKSSKALETVYKFQFQVPQELLQGRPTTTLKFVSFLSRLPKDNNVCDTVIVTSIVDVTVTPRAPVTTESPTSQSSDTTQSATEQSVTEDIMNDVCVHLGVPVGASVLAFIVGIGVGLVTCWLIYSYNIKHRQGVMKSSSQHQDSFSYNDNAPKRTLPDPPIQSALHLQLSPYSFPGPTGDIPSMPTPTPDDSSRLLAGQTPVSLPSMDKHPLNHNPHHDPTPYATTGEMISLSQNYTPPTTTTKALTIAYNGAPYPSPVGNQPSTNVLPNDPAGLTNYAREGDFMHLHMNSKTVTKPSHYAKEGENIKLADQKENVAIV